MKHGVRFWNKKLGRTPTHRQALLKNLLTQLVYHERIETTLAKAKFIQRAADRMIENVKRGTDKDLKKAQDLLFVDRITFQKLRGPLAARYAARKGGYTRLHRYGFRGLASDRAPLAIIELVDNPNDIVHGMAQKHRPSILDQLEQVQSQLYKKTIVPIHDPVSGNKVDIVQFADRHDVTGSQKWKLNEREKALSKRLAKMQKSLASYPKAREAEEAHKARVRADREASVKPAIDILSARLNAAIDTVFPKAPATGDATKDETTRTREEQSIVNEERSWFEHYIPRCRITIEKGEARIDLNPAKAPYGNREIQEYERTLENVQAVEAELNAELVIAREKLAADPDTARKHLKSREKLAADLDTARKHKTRISEIDVHSCLTNGVWVMEEMGQFELRPTAAQLAYEGKVGNPANKVKRAKVVDSGEPETSKVKESRPSRKLEEKDDSQEGNTTFWSGIKHYGSGFVEKIHSISR
ncbi:uncharacterized protein EV422DRAFT_23374 [Fimicolochytrium jonesii]|uniref:uncharacterized protein n=1 Tax=Fimicolochytrium jonesii TaxID=1396493 RepID=UPI0022FDE8AC|nr:uncharacterized protein EV422DRAFT_23374 [Fimicolochytrium jonesii]KAI8827046.1 hypothetical protein EV422DRAFT_23374 [Fimicolochytrium jonesii]